MRDNVPGCALIVLFISVVCAAITILNQTQENDERDRLARMRTVLAVITDKGVATYESRSTTPGNSGQVNVEVRHWIRFQCQVGGALREGSRLSLFPNDEKALWNSFEKGRQYEAHYDPVLDECILVVEEPPGGQSRRNMKVLLACAVMATVALVVYRATRSRPGTGEGTPGEPGP
ncbi:MAG: hypothetical protein NDJ92_12220 [Thermoanaerobaculia bacterium]|nr:hypothetical protein [Thermoanaerobaculia bacterium]